MVIPYLSEFICLRKVVGVLHIAVAHEIGRDLRETLTHLFEVAVGQRLAENLIKKVNIMFIEKQNNNNCEKNGLSKRVIETLTHLFQVAVGERLAENLSWKNIRCT